MARAWRQRFQCRAPSFASGAGVRSKCDATAVLRAVRRKAVAPDDQRQEPQPVGDARRLASKSVPRPPIQPQPTERGSMPQVTARALRHPLALGSLPDWP